MKKLFRKQKIDFFQFKWNKTQNSYTFFNFIYEYTNKYLRRIFYSIVYATQHQSLKKKTLSMNTEFSFSYCDVEIHNKLK